MSKSKKISEIEKILLKWIVNTYIDKSWLKGNNLHIDMINKKESISHIDYWMDIFQKLVDYRNLLGFEISICFNIGLNLPEETDLSRINRLIELKDNFLLDGSPSYYLIGSKDFKGFIDKKVKILDYNKDKTVYLSEYKSIFDDENKLLHLLSIIAFTKNDYKKFKENFII